MDVDDGYYKKPGAVPFKWELRPGVPKHHRALPPPHHQDSGDVPRRPAPTTPQKLRPPPSGFYFQPPPDRHSGSFRSSPRSRSDRYRFDRLIISRPVPVSPGCFPTPLRRPREDKKRTHMPASGCEPDYTSDLETLSRWSVSARRFFSPGRDSPSSYSSSSYLSSPRPVSDAEWAGFGLF